MPVLYKASFGYLLRHPWQLALAVLGICVGVAVIIAVDLANDSSRKAFQLSIDTISGNATHQVIAGPQGVDESLYIRLRVEKGLRNIAPVVEGTARVNGRSFQVLGVDLFAESAFRNFSTPAESRDAPLSSSTFIRLLMEPGSGSFCWMNQRRLYVTTSSSPGSGSIGLLGSAG